MKTCEICKIQSKYVCGNSGIYKIDICAKCRTRISRHREISRTTRDPNEFIVDDDIVSIIMYNAKGNCSGISYVNSKHLELVSIYKWSIDSDGYAICNNKGNRIRLHRLIVNAPKGTVVDHIDHNKLNNLDNNLRICTIQENNFNRAANSNNKSGVVGVSWNKSSRKWTSEITVNRTTIYLGRFTDIDDAIKARKEATIKYFGEFAYLGGKQYEHHANRRNRKR